MSERERRCRRMCSRKRERKKERRTRKSLCVSEREREDVRRYVISLKPIKILI